MTFVALEADQTITFPRRADKAGELVISLSGNHTPIIEVELEPGQAAICNLAAVMQRDAEIGTKPAPGLSQAMRLLVNNAEVATAGITLMTGCAGKAGIFDLEDHGGRLLCPQHALLAAGPGVTVTVYSRYLKLGPDGLDVMQLEGDGWAFLRACGEVKQLRLEPSKQAIIKTSAIAAMSATVDFNPLEPEEGDGFVRLTGPGQVWLQSGRVCG